MVSHRRLRKAVALLCLCLLSVGAALIVAGHLPSLALASALVSGLARDFGIAIVIAGITGIAFELVLRAESIEEWQEQAAGEMQSMLSKLRASFGLLQDSAEAGLQAIYANREEVNRRVAELLAHAQHRIWLAGITLRPLRDLPDISRLLASKAAHVQLRIGVVEPDSPWLLERGRQELPGDEGVQEAARLKQEAEDTLRFLDRLKRQPHVAPRLAFAAYDTFPLCCALLIDDVVLVGPYLYSQRGTSTYFIEVTSGGYIFSQVEAHLDRLLPEADPPQGS